jgi:hypothetical protein
MGGAAAITVSPSAGNLANNNLFVRKIEIHTRDGNNISAFVMIQQHRDRMQPRSMSQPLSSGHLCHARVLRCSSATI